MKLTYERTRIPTRSLATDSFREAVIIGPIRPRTQKYCSVTACQKSPVFLLFVYDKNNALLEYLLSLGMDQIDIFKGYLKASLLLASVLLLCEIIINITVGLYAGVSTSILATVSILAPVVGLSIVSFVTVAMISFSS